MAKHEVGTGIGADHVIEQRKIHRLGDQKFVRAWGVFKDAEIGRRSLEQSLKHHNVTDPEERAEASYNAALREIKGGKHPFNAMADNDVDPDDHRVKLFKTSIRLRTGRGLSEEEFMKPYGFKDKDQFLELLGSPNEHIADWISKSHPGLARDPSEDMTYNELEELEQKAIAEGNSSLRNAAASNAEPAGKKRTWDEANDEDLFDDIGDAEIEEMFKKALQDKGSRQGNLDTSISSNNHGGDFAAEGSRALDKKINQNALTAGPSAFPQESKKRKINEVEDNEDYGLDSIDWDADALEITTAHSTIKTVKRLRSHPPARSAQEEVPADKVEGIDHSIQHPPSNQDADSSRKLRPTSKAISSASNEGEPAYLKFFVEIKPRHFVEMELYNEKIKEYRQLKSEMETLIKTVPTPQKAYLDWMRRTDEHGLGIGKPFPEHWVTEKEKSNRLIGLRNILSTSPTPKNRGELRVLIKSSDSEHFETPTALRDRVGEEAFHRIMQKGQLPSSLAKRDDPTPLTLSRFPQYGQQHGAQLPVVTGYGYRTDTKLMYVQEQEMFRNAHVFVREQEGSLRNFLAHLRDKDSPPLDRDVLNSLGISEKGYLKIRDDEQRSFDREQREEERKRLHESDSESEMEVAVPKAAPGPCPRVNINATRFPRYRESASSATKPQPASRPRDMHRDDARDV